MFHVGIVGHRYLADQQTENFISEQCTEILRRAKAERGEVVALSAIAEGADTLFAEAALAVDIPLEIVRPFQEYEADFETPAAKARYERLRAAAVRETKFRYQERSNAAYEAAMSWVVERSDLLIVAWDGLPAEGAGGTGDAVKRATQQNKPWVHLDVTNLSVKTHTSDRT